MSTSATLPIGILTLNPSVDVSYEVDRLISDQKVHARHTRYDPGGNGINLGRMLQILGVRAETACVVAGETGRFLEQILSQEVEVARCTRVSGSTRINCTVVQADPRVQYEVTADGAPVSAQALDAVTADFLRASTDGLGVLTGSLPPGVPSAAYATLVTRLRAHGAEAVVDARPGILAHAIDAHPFLIKPNRFELEMVTGSSLTTRADVARAARRVQESGVEWVCVSLGAEGAVLVGPRDAYDAVPPPITVRSTVGAGDAMLAGLVAGFARGQPAPDVLRMAVACGSGTAETPGTQLCSAQSATRIAAGVVVRRLNGADAPVLTGGEVHEHGAGH